MPFSSIVRCSRVLMLGTIVAFGGTALAAPPAVQPFGSAVGRDLIDLPQCRVVHDGKPAAADEPRLLHALGGPPAAQQPWVRWSAGKVVGKDDSGESVDGERFEYLIAFKKPVEIGSVITTLGTLKLLKPDAPYPPDPAVAAQWIDVPVPSASGPRLATLDAAVTTRAVLFSETRRSGVSTLELVRLFAKRYGNVAPLAGARARTEYAAPENLGGSVFPAIAPLVGDGSWQSAGKNATGTINAAPISDVQPQWYAIGWSEPRLLTGLFLEDTIGELKIDTFTGPDGTPALAGVGEEWTRLKLAKYRMADRAGDGQGRWIEFTEPLRTRGLRLWITKIRDGRDTPASVARIDSLLAVEDLGTGAKPPARLVAQPPAYSIAYESPQDGMLTLVVDDAKGRRVRNLVAREQRPQGKQEESWDLTDEAGRPVPPGTYRFKGITAPPLELRYETTTYPNVTLHHPENSAWLNGHAGPGGWLADHSAPMSACTAGDHLFFGSPVPESGVGFAACDLTGKKLWGIHSFDAWSAGTSMATDGTTVFVEHAGAGHYGSADAGADRVWGVNIADHAVRRVMMATATPDRLRGIRGMAARDGRLVLAISATENWLGNACDWSAVDLAHCRPGYKPAQKPKVPYEIVPDSQGDFLRLFRLKGDPPGYGHADGGLVWLESTRGPESRQHIMLSFTKPVAIGSCVFPVPENAPYRVKLSALKPDAAYPPKPSKRDQWIDFERQAERGWDVAVAPPNTETRALLVTFFKGEDDELSDVLEAEEEAEPDAPSLDIGGDLGGDLAGDAPAEPKAAGRDAAAWNGQLEGIRILKRRFENLSDRATVRVNSGVVGSDGVWVAKPKEPLSTLAPAIYALEWKEPQSLRGVAIKEVDGELTEIDAWTGPADAAIDIEGTAHWEKVGQYIPRRRMDHGGFAGHNALARYMDDTVDFGRDVTTRAIRLRVVSQWKTNTREGSCAKDRLGLDPMRCRVFGVAPLKALGGEPPVSPLLAERLEIVDGKSGEVEREIAIPRPSYPAYAPDGTLYAVSAGRVVRVDLDGGKHVPVMESVKQPGPIACDGQGNLYVYDAAADRRVVEVFDSAGKPLRTVGEPGGHVAGPWNPRRFAKVTALAVDREGKLWCVDDSHSPKRISCWSPKGTFLREYLGPTQYGGGGVLDPGDKTRMFYGPLEFEIDWKTAATRLKNLTSTGGIPAGEVPIRIDGRTYLVTRPTFTGQPCAVVHLYDNDRLRPVAAIGRGDAFPPLAAPEFLRALGGKVPGEFQFIWTDASGDGGVQPEECRFEPLEIGSLSDFDRGLNINAGATAFEVVRFLPNGAPEYAKKKYPLPVDPRMDPVYRLFNGTFYRFGDGPKKPDAAFAADGTLLWSYRNEGAGVGPDRSCGPLTPGQVVCQFGLAGHDVAGSGDLGEFFVIHTNFGGWNLWTADGLLAGQLFRDLRDPKRVSWSMREHDRGMRLEDVTTGQEHFQGWFCRSASDGRYYAVAGHNHASVVEVTGIDRYRRFGGEITVTEEDVQRARDRNAELVAFRSAREPRVFEIQPVEGAAQARPWASLPLARQAVDPLKPGREVSFQACHDKHNLYLRYDVRGAGPFKNTGDQWDRLFKSGACVDLMLGLRSAADPLRRAPEQGDKRVLVALLDGKPAVVLYDAEVPGTKPADRWEAVSPTGRTEFDRVRRIEKTTVTLGDSHGGYVVEVVLPLKEIGLDPKPGSRIKLDWGVLETDAEGSAVLARSYWSNGSTSTLADAPTEARLEPHLWGHAIFPGQDSLGPRPPDATKLLDPNAGAADDFDLEGE
jgi:hypothetical protein